MAPQDLANRTAWLAAQVGGNYARPDTTTGVQKLRSVASIAAMTALTDLVDGEICLVKGAGFYQYDSGSSAAAVTNLIIVPTAVGAGSGRFILQVNGVLNAANGVGGLDSSAKLPLANAHNAIIERGYVTDTLTTDPTMPTWNSVVDSFTSTTPAWSSRYFYTFTSAVAIGDILRVSGRYLLTVATGNVGNFYAAVTDGANIKIDPGSYLQSGNDTAREVSFDFDYVVTSAMSANTCKVGLRANRSSGTGNVQILSTSNVRAQLIRP